jgi:hypothetical protein
MTFNNTKFGILSNWKHAWFLRREETSNPKTLEYFPVHLDEPTQLVSMLKAWVGIVLLAQDDWFYASPTPSHPPPSRNFRNTPMTLRDRKKAIRTAGNYHCHPVAGRYACLNLDFRLCRFDLSTSRCGSNGCVVNTRLLQSTPSHDLHVICKTVDVLRYPTAGNLLADEADAYAALEGLQGSVIPTLHGFYEVWGILRLLALEPVGDAISEDEEIDQTLRTKMKSALERIHGAGYIHGDIARRNFCRTPMGEVFLVDLERCRPMQNQPEADNDMDEVDEL